MSDPRWESLCVGVGSSPRLLIGVGGHVPRRQRAWVRTLEEWRQASMWCGLVRGKEGLAPLPSRAREEWRGRRGVRSLRAIGLCRVGPGVLSEEVPEGAVWWMNLLRGGCRSGSHEAWGGRAPGPVAKEARVPRPARGIGVSKAMGSCVILGSGGTIIDGGERAVVRTTAHDVHAFCA